MSGLSVSSSDDEQPIIVGVQNRRKKVIEKKVLNQMFAILHLGKK